MMFKQNDILEVDSVNETVIVYRNGERLQSEVDDNYWLQLSQPEQVPHLIRLLSDATGMKLVELSEKDMPRNYRFRFV